MVEQTNRPVEVGEREQQVFVEGRHAHLKDLGHAGLEDVLGFFGFFEGEGEHVSALRRYVDGVLGAVDAVDEGRGVELDVVPLHHLLQVDLSRDFAVVDVPVDQLGVEAARQAELLLLRLQEGNGVDDVEVALVEELHAFEIVVVQPRIALIVPSCQDIMRWFYFNH